MSHREVDEGMLDSWGEAARARSWTTAAQIDRSVGVTGSESSDERSSPLSLPSGHSLFSVLHPLGAQGKLRMCS